MEQLHEIFLSFHPWVGWKVGDFFLSPGIETKAFTVSLCLDSWTAKWMNIYCSYSNIDIVKHHNVNASSYKYNVFGMPSKSNSIFQAYANHADVLKDNDVNNTRALVFTTYLLKLCAYVLYVSRRCRYLIWGKLKFFHETRVMNKKKTYTEGFECQYPMFARKYTWLAHLTMRMRICFCAILQLKNNCIVYIAVIIWGTRKILIRAYYWLILNGKPIIVLVPFLSTFFFLYSYVI